MALMVPARADMRPALWPGARPSAVLSPEDDSLLDELQRSAFRFFVEQTDPHTGLVRDRAHSDGSKSPGKASIAASGFALSAWAVATQRGWTDRRAAIDRVRLSLKFLAEKAPRRHGFFYHFMEMGTGERAWKCEVSPIDTGLFFAGAIMAREYFGDPEITKLVNGLIRDVDWEWFLNDGKTLAMAWHDEEGFSRYRWDNYAEDMMLGFLGMGAVERPLPAGYWDSWSRTPVGTYDGFHFIEGPRALHPPVYPCLRGFPQPARRLRRLLPQFRPRLPRPAPLLHRPEKRISQLGRSALGPDVVGFGRGLQGVGRAAAHDPGQRSRRDDRALRRRGIGRVRPERGDDHPALHAHRLRGPDLEPLRLRRRVQPRDRLGQLRRHRDRPRHHAAPGGERADRLCLGGLHAGARRCRARSCAPGSSPSGATCRSPTR